ncbi:MAG: metallophosphoesterase [candidate division WOR-3 bacterium]
MFLGIISDTHDNLDRVRSAVTLFNRLGVDQVVHCGDIIAQFVLSEFVLLKAPLTIVLGNCDGDKEALRKRAAELKIKINDPPWEFTSGGKKLFVTHKPAEPIPDCDYYIYGHTHRCRYEPGKPLIINPGEACGWLSGRGTVAVLNTESDEVKFFDL